MSSGLQLGGLPGKISFQLLGAKPELPLLPTSCGGFPAAAGESVPVSGHRRLVNLVGVETALVLATGQKFPELAQLTEGRAARSELGGRIRV